MFILDDLLNNTNFPPDQKIWVGRSVSRAYQTIHKERPDKHVQTDKKGNTFEVNLYPDDFKDHTIRIINRFMKKKAKKKKWKHGDKLMRAKRKRKKIINSVPQFVKVEKK